MEFKAVFGSAVPLQEGFGPTFLLMPDKGRGTGDAVADNPELHALVQDLLQGGFQSRGYQISASDPDFLVRFDILRRLRVEKVGFDEMTYQEGVLIVDAVHPDRNQIMWRGSVQARLNEELTPQVRRERIQRAVAGIIERFPAPGQ